MMKVTVENPTGKSKAVRIPGDLHVILPGKKVSLDVDWSDEQRAKYERAGLVIKDAKAKAEADAKAKADADAKK
ncbi:hypothetical protein A8B82_21115 [Sulfitobacter sp. EhC04]|uniref:hypothetical protein n=1 Tax=Sulfitobacter sp. EhC04 TaxID=1849168 RepID=UPI0007F401E2|nr:hypothetical protein [Sulfitobacter sp. EhC04]OAN71096.1 hypothetical protein A8B82_21115 [Sulfitobacter sp. EhC04]